MAKDTEPLLGGSMKSPIDLLHVLLTECGQRCCVSTELDFKRIKLRYEAEGYSFLGITLANFGKDFQKDLDRGFVSPESFLGFKRRSGLPELLRGFLENVFEPGCGLLRPNPCIECIQSVRQITLMWAKLKQPCTDDRRRRAFTKYMERENHVQSVALGILEEHLFNDGSLRPALLRMHSRRASRLDEESTRILRFRSMSSRLFGDIFSQIDRKVFRGEIVPNHGPGSVSERLSGNQKWSRGEWNFKLESMFPFSEYYFSRWSFYMDRVSAHEPSDAPIPVRVIGVPKTHDKPRIIAIEPTAMQYMQQGIKRLFEEMFEQPNLYGKLNYSYHFVNYQSQLPNQQLALKGSIDGSLATLDLSDASDSVSNLLVENLFWNFPHLREAVQVTRSSNADVPGYGVIPLAKFASMGSALCFPIEALVFCTVVFLGIEEHLNRTLTDKDFKSFIGQVRVYGDDIIVPVEFARSVSASLKLFGFEVSPNKSFMNGLFRESCGQDCYAGESVNIVRLRQPLPTKRRQTESIIATVSFRNQLYKAGYWATVRELDALIERLIPFPAVNDGAVTLGKVSFLGYESQRWDSNLQRPLVRAAVPIYKKRKSPLDGERALTKWFFFKKAATSIDAILEKDHLLYAGRPVAVDIKHRWVHPDYGMDGLN